VAELHLLIGPKREKGSPSNLTQFFLQFFYLIDKNHRGKRIKALENSKLLMFQLVIIGDTTSLIMIRDDEDEAKAILHVLLLSKM